jgi:glycosyltransferase involved in cell wall biosynthesis
MTRTHVLHVVPALNIGGVEVGLMRSQAELKKTVSFQVFSVKGAGSLNLLSLSWGDVLKLITKRHGRPDVVVTSLWLGHLVGFFLAVCYGARWIPFFHAARSEGILRDAILRSAARFSRFAFFDSSATHRYYKRLDESNSQIVPYRFASYCQDKKQGSDQTYTCIWVGRLSPEKRPDLLVEYLWQLKRLMPNARPLVVASGEPRVQDEFSKLLKNRGLEVDIRSNVLPLEVVGLLNQSALYLSFSDYEGFGMATVDAMSCGCVPVVRPVGEIAAYVDESCGIMITDPSPLGLSVTAELSLALLKNTDQWQIFSQRARQSVTRYRLYTESYLEGVQRAIDLR